MASKIRLKQLSQDGATAGQVIVWNGIKYAPSTLTVASDAKDSVRVMATTLPAYTRTDNTINGNTGIALGNIDSVTLAAGDRLLLNIGTGHVDNGIWQVVQVTAPYQLIRSSDADTSTKVTNGMFCFVVGGSTYGQQGWILTSPQDPINLNNVALTFNNATSPDASTTVAGKVNTTTQTFAGTKTFNGGTAGTNAVQISNTAGGISSGLNVDSNGNWGIKAYSTAGYGITGQTNVSNETFGGVLGFAGSTGFGVKGDSNYGYGVIASSQTTSTRAALKIIPRPSLPSAPENGSVTILDNGSLNWYGNSAWRTAATSTDLSGYALKSGATFTGEIVVPDIKCNPGSAPSTPAEGQVYYDSTAHILKFRNASTWVDCGGGGTAVWGTISGTLSNQTDLNNALGAKADKVSITGATNTKITYNTQGIVTAGAAATTADIADSSNKRYVTDTQLTVIGNTSGVNTGDQDLSGYALKSGATFTGAVSMGASPVVTIATTGLISQYGSDLSGAPGNITSNRPTGVACIATGATTITVTNSLATASSRVMVTWYGDHGASRSWVTRAAGSFTVNLPEASSSNVPFGWEVAGLL